MTTGLAASASTLLRAHAILRAVRAALWLGLVGGSCVIAAEPQEPPAEPPQQPVVESLPSDELTAELIGPDQPVETVSGCRDDLWLVSTRASRDPCQPPHPERLRYWRRIDRQWVESNLDEFTAGAIPELPVVIWVHGNNMLPQVASASGLGVHRLIGRCHSSPVRFVIWSWPSERWTNSVVDDVRIKAPVSESQGYFIAWLIDQLPANSPVTLIGYSYGARVISAGLHMLAGGVIKGRTLAERMHPERVPPRALLMAAAQDSNGFARGGDYDLALTQLAELVVLRNRRDMVLKCYPRLERPGGPPALGQAGLTSPHGAWLFPIPRSQVQQVNVGPQVGLHHSLEYYLESPDIAAKLRHFVEDSFSAAPIVVPTANRGEVR